MYIVCFNGPPYSGKDTLARMLAEHMDSQEVVVPVIEVSLSTPLCLLSYMMVGRLYVPETYANFKNETFEQFGGATGRQLLIDVSERFLKPCYGKEIMAKMLLDQLKEVGFPDNGVVLVRDSGFQCEVQPLIDAVGEVNLFVVQMHREGCSFNNDSREWVTHTLMTRLHNSGSLDDLRWAASQLYETLIGSIGWKLA